MHYLQAARDQVAELKRIISDERLDDVTIRPSLGGNAVIWCGSDRSRARLAQVLEAQKAA